MPMSLAGRTVLVTGSTQGVGKSIALALARAGANLLVHGHLDNEAARSVVDEIRQLGRESDLIVADLMQPDLAGVEALFSRAIEKFPAIDTLVNNAGTFRDKPYLEMDLATYQQTMRLNVDAPYFLTQRFAQRWVARKTQGRVLMVGSINGRLAEPTHTAYDTSKGAVETMIKSLCVSLAPLGIRVNGMAPGLVRTPLTNIIETDERFQRWMQLHTPNGDVPSSDACGGAAVFLLSDEAWHVHGQMLLVDGGMSAWQQPDMPDNFV